MVVELIRFLQFFGPSLCASYSTIWKNDSSIGTTIFYLSSLFHLIPVHFREQFTNYFLFFPMGFFRQ